MIDAQQLVGRLRVLLVANPPPGVDAAYVAGFFDRQAVALESMISELLASRQPASQVVTPAVPEPSIPSRPTAEGGRAGLEALAPEYVRKGMRVVVDYRGYGGGEPDLHHGEVTEVDRHTLQTISYGRPVEHSVYYSFNVRMDSGRIYRSSGKQELFEELAPPDPARIVPDIAVEREGLDVVYNPPETVYNHITYSFANIARDQDKAQAARLPTKKAEWLRSAEANRRNAQKSLAVYENWLSLVPPGTPNLPHEKDERVWMLMRLGLKTTALTRYENWLLNRLRRLGELGWRARQWVVGDRLIVWQSPDGELEATPQYGWTLVQLDGDHAIIERDGVQSSATIWMIDPDMRPAGAPAVPSSSSSSDTDDESCKNIVFELPRYGRIEVTCGQQGRRDVWHNIWIGRVRYGYNDRRWAKGQVPPAEVLAAVRERGITVFGR